MWLPKHARGHPTFNTRLLTALYWIEQTIMHGGLLFLIAVFILFGCIFPAMLVRQGMIGH